MIQKFNVLPSFHGNLALGKSLVAAPGLASIWEQVFSIAAHAMQQPVQEPTPPAVPASAQISLLQLYIVELVRQIQ
ncbi:unnamed protein product [Penicillium pancosmium]